MEKFNKECKDQRFGEMTEIQYVKNIKKEVVEKADKNRFLSKIIFFIIIFSAFFSPILIMIPYNLFFTGKFEVICSRILPSLLIGSAGMATGWLQLRKPHEKWIIYRTFQREIEKDIVNYTYLLNGFTSENRDKKIIEEVTEKYLKLNKEWAGRIPTTEEILKIQKGSKV